MKAEHLEFLVEEPSRDAFLQELLPCLLDGRATFQIHAYQGKHDLLSKLESRLRGYAQWLPEAWRIVVVIDRDDDECRALKQRMEMAAKTAGFCTRVGNDGSPWRVLNRIAIEELEAWYFGEWAAVREVYPRVPPSIQRTAAYRLSDEISGGTWEALERILQRAGYFSTGLSKMECARAVGRRFNPAACSSPSFTVFRAALMEAVS